LEFSQSDPIKQLITLSVMTLSSFNCKINNKLFQQAVMISESQLNTFRDIVDVEHSSPIVESESDNFREPQPLHKRKLLDVHTPPSDSNRSNVSITLLVFCLAIINRYNSWAFHYYRMKCYILTVLVYYVWTMTMNAR
jgi:hypothetical protein